MSDETTKEETTPIEEQITEAGEPKAEEAASAVDKPVEVAEATAEAEVAQATAEAEEVEVPAEFKTIVDAVEKMTVLELNELVKVFEKKFGVSATAIAAPAAAAEAGGDEGSDEVTVELTSFGDNKIAVIKVAKEALGLGLKEAKDLVESAPAVLKEAVKKEDAEELKKKVEEAGGTVAFK